MLAYKFSSKLRATISAMDSAKRRTPHNTLRRYAVIGSAYPLRCTHQMKVTPPERITVHRGSAAMH
jgi:hypothetical protein